ncbi:MAG: hypothetical protein SGPRY_003209, partial [Prymnesium sp.]
MGGGYEGGEGGGAGVETDEELEMPAHEIRLPTEWQSKLSRTALSHAEGLPTGKLIVLCASSLEAKLNKPAHGPHTSTLPTCVWDEMIGQHGSRKGAEGALAELVSGVEKNWASHATIELFGELCGLLSADYSEVICNRVLSLLRECEDGEGLVRGEEVATTLMAEWGSALAIEQLAADGPQEGLDMKVRLDQLLLAVVGAVRTNAASGEQEVVEAVEGEEGGEGDAGGDVGEEGREGLERVRRDGERAEMQETAEGGEVRWGEAGEGQGLERMENEEGRAEFQEAAEGVEGQEAESGGMEAGEGWEGREGEERVEKEQGQEAVEGGDGEVEGMREGGQPNVSEAVEDGREDITDEGGAGKGGGMNAAAHGTEAEGEGEESSEEESEDEGEGEDAPAMGEKLSAPAEREGVEEDREGVDEGGSSKDGERAEEGGEVVKGEGEPSPPRWSSLASLLGECEGASGIERRQALFLACTAGEEGATLTLSHLKARLLQELGATQSAISLSSPSLLHALEVATEELPSSSLLALSLSEFEPLIAYLKRAFELFEELRVGLARPLPCPVQYA